MTTLRTPGESVLHTRVSSRCLPVAPKSNDYGNIHPCDFATLQARAKWNKWSLVGVVYRALPSSSLRCFVGVGGQVGGKLWKGIAGCCQSVEWEQAFGLTENDVAHSHPLSGERWYFLAMYGNRFQCTTSHYTYEDMMLVLAWLSLAGWGGFACLWSQVEWLKTLRLMGHLPMGSIFSCEASVHVRIWWLRFPALRRWSALWDSKCIVLLILHQLNLPSDLMMFKPKLKGMRDTSSCVGNGDRLTHRVWMWAICSHLATSTRCSVRGAIVQVSALGSGNTDASSSCSARLCDSQWWTWLLHH